MAFVAIEYWLKNIFDDYYTFIPLAIKHKIEIGYISITRSCVCQILATIYKDKRVRVFKGKI